MEVIAAPDVVDYKLLEEEIIPELQSIQLEHGYISRSQVQAVAERFRLPESRIYGVASFYTQFRFTPPARHTLRICLGTACHVGGGASLSRALERKLGITPGETTPDGRFELQQVACLGCCAQSPVLQVDERIFGQVKIAALDEILSEFD